MQAAVDQGVNLSVKQLTVAEWGKLWLEAFSPNLKQNIREDYAGVVRRTIEGTFIGRRKLDQLTPSDVQSWVNTLSRQVAPQTVRNAHARLRKALGVRVRHGYIGHNVAVGIELPQVRPLPIQPFDFAQTRTLLQGLEGHRWYALYRLTVNLGLREGELLGLIWEDVDLDRSLLRIRRQLRRVQGPEGAKVFVLQTTKTKAGERILILDADLVAVLREHLRNQTEERQLPGSQWKNTLNLVFMTETRAPVHSSDLVQHFKRTLTRLELLKIRFHDLRHTAATLMLAGGVPLVTVSKILGHSSPAIIATIYAHALEAQKASAIADLSRRLQSEQNVPRDSQRDSHPPKKNPAPLDEEHGMPHCEAGAGGGTRTRTGFRPTVFKTVASAVPPLRPGLYDTTPPGPEATCLAPPRRTPPAPGQSPRASATGRRRRRRARAAPVRSRRSPGPAGWWGAHPFAVPYKPPQGTAALQAAGECGQCHETLHFAVFGATIEHIPARIVRVAGCVAYASAIASSVLTVGTRPMRM